MYEPLAQTSALVESKVILRKPLDDDNGSLLPDPILLRNLTDSWHILDMIWQDWKLVSRPFQDSIDRFPSNIYYVAYAMDRLRLPFLKAVFSYVSMLDGVVQAYDKLYAQLKELNRSTAFQVNSGKKPRRNDTVIKAKLVRDRAVAHFPSEKADGLEDALTSRVVAFWDFIWGSQTGQRRNVDEFELIGANLVVHDDDGNVTARSRDVGIRGMKQLHEDSMDYLIRFDAYCANYLDLLSAKLPAEDTKFTYELWDP